MRRSARIRNKNLALVVCNSHESSNDNNSSSSCNLYNYQETYTGVGYLRSRKMIGQGDGSRTSERSEGNYYLQEFLPNCQDQNLFFETETSKPFVLNDKILKCLSLILSTLCTFAITYFITSYFSIGVSPTNSVKIKQTTTTDNFNLAICDGPSQHHEERVAHLSTNLKSVTHKLEVLYGTQVILQKQLSEMKSKLESFETEVSSKIEQSLKLHDADKVGMIDYALKSAGGYIVSTPETDGYSNIISYDFMGVIKLKKASNPSLVIQPGVLPGECFAFKGHRGRIQIGLVQMIEITAVTIEHTSPNLVESINSAPKNFIVYGLNNKGGEDKDELGRFTYRVEEKPLQTFEIERGNSKSYQFVEFSFLTNYGNREYTCVYRVRVHGNSKAKIEKL